MRRFIKDNRGMTLIELLIAITILGLVAAPLLHGFLTSAQTEVKARKMGEVTSVAQNVMETVEGNSFDKIVENNSTIFGAISTVTQTGENYKNYKVNIPGVASYPGGRTYNATVDIKPLDEINRTELSEHKQMDVVFQVGKNTQDKDRTITLTVTKDGSSVIKFKLENDCPETDEDVGDDSQGGEIIIPGESEDDSDQEQNQNQEQYPEAGAAGTAKGEGNKYVYTLISTSDVPAVYLFYYPNYKVEAGNIITRKDTIEIINKDDVKFDLYLIKQRHDNMTGTNLDTCEMGSVCHVEQYLTGEYRYNNKIGANIYTNIRENLAYTIGHAGASRLIGSTADLKYNIYQGNTPIADTSLAEDTNNFLVQGEAKPRAYEYTVKVFINEADVLSTMKGTILKQ